MLSAIEFFAGSGLVRLGLEPGFKSVWANDVSSKKRATYVANFGDEVFRLGSIKDLCGEEIPAADLAWASFPCQDLSLAGNMSGMNKGTRSGLFWDWIRLLWEMRALGKSPSVLAVENVVGFLVAEQGRHFREAHHALRELGYKVGAVVINARHFVPQSRARAFVVAVRDGVDLEGLIQDRPSGHYHTPALVREAGKLQESAWVWWSLPSPSHDIPKLGSLCENQVNSDSAEKTSQLVAMLPPEHKRRIEAVLSSGGTFAATGYRRTRVDAQGASVQRLELRFDGIAGCLRTPDGGSSRQTLILIENGKILSRLLTGRECARLMGAPDSFLLPGSYNDAYRAMGDGVSVPVTRWLSQHLLEPLARRAKGIPTEDSFRATTWDIVPPLFSHSEHRPHG